MYHIDHVKKGYEYYENVTQCRVFNTVHVHFNIVKISMDRSIHFKGGNSYLSNFCVCRIQVWNHVFNTLEAAYMWKKCIHHGYMETAEQIIATRTGLQAKYLSKSIREKVQLRAEWNKQRYYVMYALVAVKFRDAILRKWLLDTQQA